jgi:hypothetical protein
LFLSVIWSYPVARGVEVGLKTEERLELTSKLAHFTPTEPRFSFLSPIISRDIVEARDFIPAALPPLRSDGGAGP